LETECSLGQVVKVFGPEIAETSMKECEDPKTLFLSDLIQEQHLSGKNATGHHQNSQDLNSIAERFTTVL
jgi:hypothetical protein